MTALQPLQIDVNQPLWRRLRTANTGLYRGNLFGKLEGVLFDPVYSGKALAAMIDQINLGNFNDVVLVHTGGSASLSAYVDAFEP